ncbi:uncharacterized protein LOC116603976 [Nematostella vectensis]|uniref:uncharacterized protein LOC116603976 n=1 Tax=Nematostella vectensis TaxID=45351 RepID=UPI0013900019|nr:uncharacterized protein LOC116603976 [Nematostella vectensis]
MSSPKKSPKKAITFKSYVAQNSARLEERYPFLPKAQIQAKLKILWRKMISEENLKRDKRENARSPGKTKTTSPIKDKPNVTSIPFTLMDDGVEPEMESSDLNLSLLSNSLTEESVNDVNSFELHMVNEDDAGPKLEEIVGGLFEPHSNQGQQESRLLTSEASRQENFNAMFNEDEVFL